LTEFARDMAKKLYFLGVEICSRFIPPKNGLVIVIPVHGYDGNARAIYERLMAEGTNPVWISFNSHLSCAKERSAKAWSPVGFYCLLRASVVLAEAGLSGIMPTGNAEQRLIIQMWHGVGLKRLGLQDRGRSEESLQGDLKDASRWNLFLTTSEFCAKHFAEAFGISKDKIKVWGYPRHDRLLSPTAMDLVAFEELDRLIKERLPEVRKVVAFCPTFREDFRDKRWPVEESKMELLSQLLKKHSAVCLCKWHPVVYNRSVIHSDTLRSKKGSLCYPSKWKRIAVISPDVEVPQWVLLRLFDVLITDFSSIAYDFMLLQKPIIVSAAEEEIKTYEMSRGLIEGWDRLMPGVLATDDDQLLGALDDILSADASALWHTNTKFEEVRRVFLEESLEGRATERLVERILAWLNKEGMQ